MKAYQGLQLEELLHKIANYCFFSKGKEHLLSTTPTMHRLEIIRRNKQTKEALECVIRYGTMPFDGIRDIDSILQVALRDGICSGYDLLQVLDHERGLMSLRNYLSKVEFDVALLMELAHSLVSNQQVADKITSCIDKFGEVVDHASPQLSSIRKRLRKIEGELSKEAQKFIASNASKLMDTIITTRNNRYVVLAKISEKNALGGFVHGESASGQTAYIEPASLLPLNNEKQSLISQEIEEVQRILLECSQCLKSVAHSYLDNLETLALLDSLFAKAQYGKEVDGIMATISDKQELLLKQARHPFIDRKEVVANTYRMNQDTKVLLISGPNTGGKTVSLKCVGLFVLMSYCGIPIGCDEAIIPFYDEVFMDLTDDQSITNSLSTFSAHISKLAMITNHVTSQSLVLLDEIGSGTDPKEGESLAIAILNDLRLKKCMCIVTTHYGRLKAYGKKHHDILLASVHFDVEAMRPTFKFIEGLSGQSNAFTIAKRYNLKESILKEAEFLKQQQKTTEDELIEKLELQVLQQEENNIALQQELEEISALKLKLLKQEEAFISHKERLMDKAKEEASEYIQQIKLEAELVFENLKQAQAIKPHQYNAFKQEIEGLVEEEIEQSEDKDFNVGDAVSLKNSHQLGEIISINNNKVMVDVNGMKITTKKENLVHRIVQQKKHKKTLKSIDHIKPKVALECNLIGLRVEEALVVFEKYMDDALLAGLGQVRIIHGVGTGALRTAIHERLKKRKDVTYRLGGQGEGGVGASVVSFVSKS